jgi:hypothetical protein
MSLFLAENGTLYLLDGKLVMHSGEGPPSCCCPTTTTTPPPCEGPCDTSCYVAYCCSPDGQCGPNGDGCADFLGCQERWNAPAFFATGAEAQEFADNFNADNPSWQFGCGMYVFTSQELGLECPPEKQSNPCPEGCECVDGQCVAESGDCATNGCPPPEISGDEATVFCCGKFYFNPAWPPEEQFQKGECFPGYNTAYFCLANECSLEDYLAFNCPDSVRSDIWIDTPCGDNGGCPDGSRCVSIRVCPGA